MRLAIVCDGYWDQLQGGAEYQLWVIGEALAARGVEVHYVFRDRGTPVAPTPMHLHPMRISPLVARLFYPYQPLLAGALERALDAIGPDLILNRVGNALTGLCARYGLRRRVPVVWHVAHLADLLPFEPPRNRTLPMAWWNRRLLEYGIRHATAVVAQAQYQADELERRWRRKADLVFPNVHPVPPAPQKAASPVRVLWVANVKPMKQPFAFLDLAEAFSDREEVDFTLIGRPENQRYQERFEARLRTLPRVRYLGEQPIERVNEEMAGAHVFVNTSRLEGFPNSFIQAWLREVPVVSLSVDPDDVLVRQRIGMHSRTPARLVEDTARLVEDAALREEMGRRARAYAIEAHGLERHIGALQSLFEDLVR